MYLVYKYIYASTVSRMHVYYMSKLITFILSLLNYNDIYLCIEKCYVCVYFKRPRSKSV